MSKDAWEQLDDLRHKYGMEWNFRDDLFVFADGCERHIMLNNHQHNVCTVREYIAILEEACDFVEQVNPKWSNRK